LKGLRAAEKAKKGDGSKSAKPAERKAKEGGNRKSATNRKNFISNVKIENEKLA